MPDGWTLDDDGALVALIAPDVLAQLVEATSLRHLDGELEEWLETDGEEWDAADQGGWLDA